jgi:succinoglycan biosynthesis transport protein ExoP
MLQKRSEVDVMTGSGVEPEFAKLNQLVPSLDVLIGAFKRQWKLIAATIIVALSLAFAYIQLAQPLYRSESGLLISQAGDNLLTEIVEGEPLVIDDSYILDQLELLSSERVARKVVELLRLDRNEAYLAPRIGIGTNLVSLMRETLLTYGSGILPKSALDSLDGTEDSAPAPGETDRTEEAVSRLMENTSIERSGRSSVVFIAYTDPDPELAAEIVQAFSQAYIVDAIDAKVSAMRSATEWLERRVTELRQRSLDTDLAVQRFKAEHGLLTTAEGFVSDQNFSGLNQQLIEAQAATSAAYARYERLQATIQTQEIDSVVNDALDSVLINNLRTQYLQATKRKSELETQLGPDHIQVRRLDAEILQFRRLIFEELSRIAESYRNEAEVAKLREDAIRSTVEKEADATVVSNDLRVQLRELEREAETQRTLYSTYLSRYEDALQKESAPTMDARVIANAKVPQDPSWPSAFVVLALGAVIGGLGGTTLGLFREFQDRFFRTGEQIRAELGQSFLGSVPTISTKPSPLGGQVDTSHPTSINKISPAYNFVLDHPSSQYAETMRGTKFAIDLALRTRRPKLIGIVSLMPNEGKTIISVNLAEMIASQGARTLLIDADLRKPGLTRALARHSSAGLVDVILGRRSLDSVILKNLESGLDVLPAHARTQHVHHSSSLLASDGMSSLLEEAGKRYEYVIVDLPPIGPVIDALAISDKLDGFVMVVHWGHTARTAVRNALKSAPLIADRCFGVLLNRVDMGAVKKYARHGDDEFYGTEYNKYYLSGQIAPFK